MERRELCCTFGGNVNQCSLCGKQCGDISNTIKKIELQYHSAISLRGIYKKEMKSLSQTETYPSMFIAALFRIKA